MMTRKINCSCLLHGGCFRRRPPLLKGGPVNTPDYRRLVSSHHRSQTRRERGQLQHEFVPSSSSSSSPFPRPPGRRPTRSLPQRNVSSKSLSPRSVAATCDLFWYSSVKTNRKGGKQARRSVTLEFLPCSLNFGSLFERGGVYESILISWTLA